MSPVRLPRPTHENIERSQSALDAYARLLLLENEHEVAVRLCGWMMIHAPLATGRDYVAESVNRCNGVGEIIEVGDWLKHYFVAYFRARLYHSTHTPSTHPSRPSIDELQNNIAALLDEAPQNHGDAKDHALVRDKYRCMLSGHVDSASYERMTDLHNIDGISAAPTECCHILPQYLNQRLGDTVRLDASATVWTVLQCFGGIAVEELNGPGIHNLRNILTLRNDIHKSFDSLRIWLEPVEGTEHTYAIGRSLPGFHPELPAEIKFETESGLPLPDRRYLALHAACAKVIHMSGAAQAVNKILDEIAETKVLSGDGSSCELLAHLLSAEVLVVY